MARYSVEEDDVAGEIIVEMPYDEDAKEALKEKFAARWRPADKVWVIDGADYSAREVEQELKLHFRR